MTKIIPSETNILVEKIVKQATKNGILLPENSNTETLTKGRILEVGPGKMLDDGKYRKMQYKKDDIVLFTQAEYSKKEIDVDGKLLIILNEKDILAKIQE